MKLLITRANLYKSFLVLLLFVTAPINEYAAAASDAESKAASIGLEQLKFETNQDIYVVGDIHGAYADFVKSLRTVELIDAEDNWIGDKAHFVSLGDLVDRGPASRKLMDLFIKLQTQAYLAGGRFHIVLGNHEVMNLIGDLRYLSKEEISEFVNDEPIETRDKAYTDFLTSNRLEDSPKLRNKFNESYPTGYFARLKAFAPEGKYGNWLLKLPFVIQINDRLFTHGGLSKLAQEYSLEEFNREAKEGINKYLKQWRIISRKEKLSTLTPYKQRGELIKSLNNSKLLKRYNRSKNHFILTPKGPTWYRGNALCHPYFEQELLTNTLNRWEAKELWVGHTTSQTRKPLIRFDGALKIMDTGMLNSHYGGAPWIGKLSGSNPPIYIQGLTNTQKKPDRSPAREWNNPYNMSDKQVEEFLQTASIKKIGTTKEGKTRPYKVKLTIGKRSIKGIFKYYDSTKEAKGRSSRKNKFLTDRYQHEIAAYKLDRLLGIGLVPVTITRKLNGRDGIVQVWVDELISELEMTDNKVPYNGHCDHASQESFLNAFDYLIANRDRNQSNVLFTKSDMQIWFIDHSRAFGIKSIRPKEMKNARIHVSPQFKAALSQLNINKLQVLKPWLKGRQLNGILKRRDKMLNGDM